MARAPVDARDHLLALVQRALLDLDDEVAVFWRALLGRFVEASRKRIEAEIAAGTSTAHPVDATAFALCWMVERALYQELVQGAPIRREDLVEALVRIWMRTVYDR
jgi:hypothetical protein